MTQAETAAALREAAARRYGAAGAEELEPMLAQLARAIALVEQQPLDLLGEDPDDGR